MSSRGSLMARLTVTAAGLAAPPELPPRLCEATRILADADGASLSLAGGSDDVPRVVLWSSNDTAARVDQFQDDLGAGPAIEALRSGEVVAAPLDTARSRWPFLTERLLRDTDVLSLTALPMHAGTAVLGVFQLYRSRSGPLAEELDDLAFVADALAVAVLRDTPIGSLPAETSWRDRSTVHQASGMVMAQLSVPAPDAMALLRAHAFARGVSLVDVARLVLDRELDLSSDGGRD